MTKKILLFTFFLLGVKSGYGQMVENQSISSAGDFSSPNGQLSWTIGETLSETFYEGEYEVLTQGFHQPFIIINGIGGHIPLVNILVFPNPTSKNLTVKFENADKNRRVEFYNTEGKLVLSEKIPFSTETNLELSSIPGGLYFLYIKEDEQILKSYRIIKL